MDSERKGELVQFPVTDAALMRIIARESRKLGQLREELLRVAEACDLTETGRRCPFCRLPGGEKR